MSLNLRKNDMDLKEPTILQSDKARKENHLKQNVPGGLDGPDRIRTDDPHNANVMRSQLRYRPK